MEAARAKVVIEIRGDDINLYQDGCDMNDLLIICGAIQQMIGVKIAGMGDDCEDIAKSCLLDIHLAAMEAMSEQLRKERRKGNVQDHV